VISITLNLSDTLAQDSCPLDNSHTTRLLERMPVDVLISAARRELDIDTRAEFHGVNELGRYQCSDCGLEFFSPPVTGGSQFYEALVRQPWYQPVGKFEYDLAAGLIEAGESVLDIGCGNGRFSSRVPAASFTGLAPDGSDKSLGPQAQVLRRTLAEHRERVVQGEVERYDWVCAFQVLEHVADPLTFVQQALECLKPGGRLLLGMPNKDSYIGGLVNFALNSPPHHVAGWSEQALGFLESRLGLQRVGLHHAPLEDWEQVLFWMQRGYRRFTSAGQRFSTDKRWQALIPLSYFWAKLSMHWRTVPAGVQGSTMVWVVTR